MLKNLNKLYPSWRITKQLKKGPRNSSSKTSIITHWVASQIVLFAFSWTLANCGRLDNSAKYSFINISHSTPYTTAVWKVHGLALLLRVGTLWRCGDSLFFEVPPLASGALLTTLHPLLENMPQTVDHFEISCLRAPFWMVAKAHKSHGARSELNSVFRLGKVDRWNPIRTSAIQSRSRPMRFLGFSNHEKGAPRQEISKWSTVSGTF
jgi:hypothetical protein